MTDFAFQAANLLLSFYYMSFTKVRLHLKLVRFRFVFAS